ncbi:hypothetical protein [Rosenbergiella epipactidis]|uniref:hypothetical protein n=1 Tax=Rosenbergiella epipactidis TaxID=1544694 RepID=UPI001F4D6A6F|nr:hypothetical protein [Rosenbergiella epipactidis]
MLVECIFNSGKDVPLECRYCYETEETDYSFLEVGAEYYVYGLIFRPLRVDYFVRIGNGNPDWMPGNLFKMKGQGVPIGWSICVTYLNDDYKYLYEKFNILSIISYPELVNSISHFEGVLERDPDEMIKFFLEKEKMDSISRE